MRRLALALAPLLCSCGLLMDFELGGEGGAGATSTGTTSSSQGTITVTSSGTLDVTSAASSSTGEGGAAGGRGAAGGGGGPPLGPPWSVVISGSEADANLLSLAVSPQGRVAVAGYFSGPLDLLDLETDAGMTGTFVAEFDPSGALDWAQRLTQYSAGRADNLSLAYDQEDNLVIAGSYSQALQLGSQEVPNDDGGSDAFVAKVGAGGDVIWLHAYESDETVFANAVAVDTDGRVFVTGFYCGAVLISPPGDGACDAPPDLDCARESNFDVFVARLDVDGSCQRLVSFGGVDEEVSRQRAHDIDVAGDYVGLAGVFDGSLNLGGKLLAPSESETFVAVLDEDLEAQDAWSLGSPANPSVDVLVDEDGKLDFFGPMRPPVLGFGAAASGANFMAGRVAVDLTPEMTLNFGGTGEDGGVLQRAPDGSLSAYGYFRGDASFVDRTPPHDPRSSGDLQADAFLVRLSGNGDEVTLVKTFGGDGEQLILAAGFDASGSEVVAGLLTAPFELDGQQLDHSGTLGIFVVAKGPVVPPQ